jgi:ABC-type multidrug transport system permease subunit
MWLLFWQFVIFTCTFAHACIAITDTAEAGGNLANVLFMLCLFFCGVLASPSSMPGFWVFMYRANPFTYWVSAVLSTGLANQDVQCASNELVKVTAPDGLTCGDWLGPYAKAAGGKLWNEAATGVCEYCPVASTNTFLQQISASYANRWRDFGIGNAFIMFNIFASIFLYWLVRMPKGKKKE